MHTFLRSDDRSGGRVGLACSGSRSSALGTWESAGRSISRAPGMAVFISESATGLPAGFVSMLRSVGVVHTAVVFLTVQRVRVPLSHPVTFVRRGAHRYMAVQALVRQR